MPQSMRPSSPSDTSRGTKSKHFLSRFLANPTHVYTYDGTASSTDPTYNLQTEHNKTKKTKGIGRRMLQRFTSKAETRGSANWNTDSSSAHRHHSTPTVTTNVSTPLMGPRLDHPNSTTNSAVSTNKGIVSAKATTAEKAQRRRSATLPSVMYSPPLTPSPPTAKLDAAATHTTTHYEGDNVTTDTTTTVSNGSHDNLTAQKDVIQIKVHNSDDGDDDDSSSDESFVDASDELESDRPTKQHSDSKKRSSITHRLSAGYFGSAGGLVVNMHHSLRNRQSRQSMAQQQLRNSPPPDDLAKAMLDWKRKSVGDGTIDKRFSINSTNPAEATSPPQDEHDAPELSKEDKEALRAHAESILMGNDSSTLPPPPPPLPTTGHLHHERSRSIKALSEMFSKTLDEAWNNSDTASQLSHLDQVHDPRLLTAWTRPTLLSTKAQETARRIWDCDESFLPVDRYAEWLGQSTHYNAETLVCYMDLFYFTDMKLDSAFRKLCSKLYFKAEAQQIDRILEVFAHRFWDCNPNSDFKCPDVVYAVVYSLLLLNTDLHVAQGNHHRMSKQEFIKNTMLAIHAQLRLQPEIVDSIHFNADMEKYLKEIYMSVKNYQILQPLSDENGPYDTRAGGNALRPVESLKRGVSSIIRKAGRESIMMATYEPPPTMPRPTSPLSTGSRSSVYHSSSSSPPPPSRMSMTASRRLSRSLSLRQTSSSLTASAKYPSNGSMTSIGSSTISSLDGATLKPVDERTHKRNTTHGSSRLNALPTILFTPGTFLQDAPYAKESVVMCKHLLKSSDHKAKSREWKEYLMVVDDQGIIKLYDIPGQRETERMTQGSIDLLRPSHGGGRHARKHIEGPLSRFDPSWNALLVLTIDLKHTLCNVLPPPGYNKLRPHVFALQQPNGGVYLFQGPSLDDVTTWVSTCNYWAARQSKEPLQGGVGNMDYGWGECLHTVIVDLDAIQNGDALTGNDVGGGDPDSLVLYDWQPPVAPLVPSIHTDDAAAQLRALTAHLHWLHAEINDHREIKTKMLVRFPSKRSFNYKRALANWSLKSSYLLGDIIKYQHYCDALDGSLSEAALDQVLDFHDMDLIKEIENELVL